MVSMADLQREQAWRATAQTGSNDLNQRVARSNARVRDLAESGIPMEVQGSGDKSRDKAAFPLQAPRTAPSRLMAGFGESASSPTLRQIFEGQEPSGTMDLGTPSGDVAHGDFGRDHKFYSNGDFGDGFDFSLGDVDHLVMHGEDEPVRVNKPR